MYLLSPRGWLIPIPLLLQREWVYLFGFGRVMLEQVELVGGRHCSWPWQGLAGF